MRKAVAFACPPVWLAAFVVGRWIGLVPAVAAASGLLLAAALVADGRALARLFLSDGRTGRAALAGLAGAIALVAGPGVGFRLVAPHLPALAESVAGLYQRFGPAGPGRICLVAGIVVAEEILWRGLLQSAIAPRAGRATVPVAAAIYAGSHLTSGLPLLVLMALVLGAFWSWLRARTGGLMAPLLSHLAFDLAFLAFWRFDR